MIRWFVQFLILLATWSLIYYRKVTEWGVFTLASVSYRSDFVFGLAIVVAIIGTIFGHRSRRKRPWSQPAKGLVAVFGSYLVFCSAATLLSFYYYNLWFDNFSFLGVVKILLGFGTFVVTYSYARDDSVFYKRVVWALYLSQIVPLALGLVFLVTPQLFWRISDFVSPGPEPWVIGYGDRFMGLTSNPVQLALGAIVAISFGWVLAICDFQKGRRARALWRLAYILGLLAISILTLVRTALGAFGMVFAVGSLVRNYSRGGRKVRSVWPIACLIGLFLALGAWQLVPSETTGLLDQRLAGKLLSGRSEIWGYYLPIALKHPLGVGFNYQIKFVAETYEITSKYMRKGMPPHSQMLEAWMQGGLGATLSMVVLLIIVLRQIRAELRANAREEGFKYFWGAVTAWAALGVFNLFSGSPFVEFTEQILLALIVAGTPKMPAVSPEGVKHLRRVRLSPIVVQERVPVAPSQT